jgi:hypothetical protein
MTGHEYLSSVLRRETIRPNDVAALQRLRAVIETGLRAQFGASPRFYYGGSYGKDTMLQSAYDLDIVMYFPPTEPSSLRDLYWAVYQRLRGLNYVVTPRTVALRLPYQGSFHIDLVTGRAQDATFHYATLYKNTTPESTLQTSLKIHIDAVRKTGIGDIVRLMKLWRLQGRLNWPTFALEIAVGRALAGRRKDDLGNAMWTTIEYLAANVGSMRFEDPANTNNIVLVGGAERAAVAAAAHSALRAKAWNEIVR